MGAGRGGGISGISTTGGTLRGFGAFTGAFTASAGFRALAAPPAGFARRAFARRALRGFAFPRGRPCEPISGTGASSPWPRTLLSARVRRQPRCARLEMPRARLYPHARRAPARAAHARPHRHATEPVDIEADLLVLALGEAELEGGEPARAHRRARRRRVATRGRRRAVPRQARADAGGARARSCARSASRSSVSARARTLADRRCASRPAARRASPRAWARARAAFAWSSAASRTATRACEVAAEGALLGAYRFDKYLTDERSRAPATTTLHPAAARRASPPPTASARSPARARPRAPSRAHAISSTSPPAR